MLISLPPQFPRNSLFNVFPYHNRCTVLRSVSLPTPQDTEVGFLLLNHPASAATPAMNVGHREGGEGQLLRLAVVGWERALGKQILGKKALDSWRGFSFQSLQDFLFGLQLPDQFVISWHKTNRLKTEVFSARKLSLRNGQNSPTFCTQVLRDLA